MADMITEAVVSSVFDKQLSKMHVVRGGKEEERASGKRSALLWSSSYGPSHSWASESEALPPPPPSTSTSTISTTSTLEHGKLSRFAQSCMKRFLSMGEDLDDDTRWWQEHGTKTVLVTLAPLTSLSLILLLFDFGSPNDQDMLSHIGWLAVYDFFIPLSYSYYMRIAISDHVRVTHSSISNLFPPICGVATFAAVYLSGVVGGFPVKFSLCYFFAISLVTITLMYGGMACRAKSQGKQTKFFKLLMICGLFLMLLVGWTFATIVLRIFNSSGVFMQSLIVSGLGIWKCTCMVMIKFASKLVRYSGEKYELLLVAISCVFVHWFWTLFTNIAFAAVESVWTFIIYLVLDMMTGLLYIVQATELSVTTDFRVWVPFDDNDDNDDNDNDNDDNDNDNDNDNNDNNDDNDIFDSWFFEKILKKRPVRKSLDKMTTEEREEAHFETLFNVVCFFCIQCGECMFAVYTITLFLVVRFGPNSEYSALSPERVSSEGFNMIITFLVIIVLSEFIVSWLAVRSVAKTSRNAIDPRAYIGHFARDHIFYLALVPLSINFPCTMLLIDHSGMGLEIGD